MKNTFQFLLTLTALFMTLLVSSEANSAALAKSKMPKALKKALCATNPAVALGILNKLEDSAANNLYAAIALKQGGKHISARAIFAKLARSLEDDTVELKCRKNGPRFKGEINSVAAKQLVSLQRTLMDHDVQLIPARELHAALLPMKAKPAAKKTGFKVNKQAASGLKLNTKISMPMTANLQGSWFAHFTSYFDPDKADSGIATLEKRYSALRGAVGAWTVNGANRTVWRVGVAVDEWSDADRLCVTIRARGDYCKVIDRLQ